MAGWREAWEKLAEAYSRARLRVPAREPSDPYEAVSEAFVLEQLNPNCTPRTGIPEGMVVRPVFLRRAERKRVQALVEAVAERMIRGVASRFGLGIGGVVPTADSVRYVENIARLIYWEKEVDKALELVERVEKALGLHTTCLRSSVDVAVGVAAYESLSWKRRLSDLCRWFRVVSGTYYVHVRPKDAHVALESLGSYIALQRAGDTGRCFALLVDGLVEVAVEAYSGLILVKADVAVLRDPFHSLDELVVSGGERGRGGAVRRREAAQSAVQGPRHRGAERWRQGNEAPDKHQGDR